MPNIVSEAQRRAMRAAAAGHSTLGISKATGASAEDPGGKLPAKVHEGKPVGLQTLINKRKKP